MTSPRIHEASRAPAGTQPTVLELGIDELATGGDGVGKDADGRVVFVPGSAPGDRLEVRLTERKKSFARGEVVRVLAPSPDRVSPPCPLFVSSTCGGCQWQHIELGRQRRAKADIVARELRKAVAAGMELLPIAGDVPAYHWRRRARLQYVRPRGARVALIGLYAPRSHRVTDVPVCPQLDPVLEDALAIVRAELAPRLPGRGEIELLSGHGGQVHVAVTGPCPQDAAAALIGKGGAHGTIAGVLLTLPPRPSAPGDAQGQGTERARPRRRQLGAPFIEIEPGLGGRADLFAQASHAGNQALLVAVAGALGPLAGKRVVELHAGTGNLTRLLGDAAEVVAVDSRRVPWPTPVVPGVAHEVVRALAAEGRAFDIVLLDPPRTGATDLIEPLFGLGPERIVYVSCDPATLARDIEALAAGGYRAARAQPLDLMPQTAHVEVVAVLERTAREG